MQRFSSKERSITPERTETHSLVLHPIHMDDVTLWRAFRGGDDKALITIFNRFSDPMFNYGCRIFGDREQVKDAIQELFIEIWRKRSRLGDTDSIKSYLYKSLRRKLARIRAKTKHHRFIELSDEAFSQSSPSTEFVLVSEQASAEQRDRLMSMLEKLTKRQKEALFLRYFDELNYDEIASVMELSKQGVYNLIHHAIRELKRGVEGGATW